jgi:hypothetical protein
VLDEIDETNNNKPGPGTEVEASAADKGLSDGSTPYSLLLERFRAALCASEPAIDAAIVRGETLEEVEASFAEARTLVARVREQMRKEGVAVSVGAPGRVSRVPVSPFDKIRAGLTRQ